MEGGWDGVYPRWKDVMGEGTRLLGMIGTEG